MRALPHRRPVRVKVVDRKEHALDLVAETERSFGGRLDEVEAFLARLGLIPAKLRLKPAIALFVNQAVGASYDRDTVRVFDANVSDSTLVHEMVHALQDQNFAMASANEQTPGVDAGIAFQALLEGDADFTEGLAMHPEYARDLEVHAKRLRAESEAAEARARQGAALTPAIFSRTQTFWYTRGEEFALALYRSGGWGAVNRAWGAPPESSEQVLHPEKYLAREHPVRIDTSELEASLIADGWAVRYATPVGELVTEIWLEQAGPRPVDVGATFKAAAGWGGDRGVLCERDGARFGLWLSTWDSEDEAREFVSLAERTLPAADGTDGDPDREVRLMPDGLHAVLRRGADVFILLGCPPERLAGIEEKAWAAPRTIGTRRK
ncbi:MAG: hypothetical protein HYY93_10360 [Planctomycetes bacterium]|nr:hypothetical protein [Planctomycetota bacterium]